MFGHSKDTRGLINDRVQLKIKWSYLYFLILWRPLVSIVCIRTYIIMYNQRSCQKKSLSHWWGSIMENQWLAINFSGDHMLSTCGHFHLCAYKVSVSATCDRKIMFSHYKDTGSSINDWVQLKIKCSFLYFLILWRPLVSIVGIRTYIIIYNLWSHHKMSLRHRRETSDSPLIWVAITCSWRAYTPIYVHIKSVSPLLVVATSSSVWMYLNCENNRSQL